MNPITSRIADRRCPGCQTRLSYQSGLRGGNVEYEEMHCPACGNIYELQPVELQWLGRIVMLMLGIAVAIIALIWFGVAVLELGVNTVTLLIVIIVAGLVAIGQILAGLRLRRQGLKLKSEDMT